MKNKPGLIQKWANFAYVVLSPGALIFLSLTVLGLYLAIARFEGVLADTLSVFASLASALGGIFLKDDWDRLQGSTFLEKKGRSAVRNLESIDQQISKIREWTVEFLNSRKVTKDSLREIDRHLSMTKFNVQSGIEDWKDVVPELEIFFEIKQKEKEAFYLQEKIRQSRPGFVPTTFSPPMPTAYAGGISVEDLQNQVQSLLQQISELQKELGNLNEGEK